MEEVKRIFLSIWPSVWLNAWPCVWLSVLLLSPWTSFAGEPVPYLPVRVGASWGISSPESSPRSQVASYDERRANRIQMGLEAGGVGRRNNTNIDFLGLNFLWGGRMVGYVPVDSVLLAKASLGFFHKKEGTPVAGVTQNTLEAGLIAYYRISTTLSKLSWFVGLSQRLDLMFSKFSVPNASESMTAWRYRLGGATGVDFKLSPTMGFIADIEVTFPLSTPVRTHGGISAGLVFEI